jgi:hypothetical protein
MKNFPTVCVDDFYPDPDIVREFALKQQFNKPLKGFWPGLRTYPIHELDADFFKYFTSKFFGLFYNFEQEIDITWKVKSFFQLIPPLSNDKDSAFNEGLIHRDAGLAAGIIYLNPNPNPDTGTSLFHPKKDRLPSILDNRFRENLYIGEEVDHEEYKKLLNEHNSKFEESVTFKNKYNRLIAYDSEVFHKANSYYTGNNSEPRLIQVFFIETLSTDYMPLQRINKDMI